MKEERNDRYNRLKEKNKLKKNDIKGLKENSKQRREKYREEWQKVSN